MGAKVSATEAEKKASSGGSRLRLPELNPKIKRVQQPRELASQRLRRQLQYCNAKFTFVGTPGLYSCHTPS